jgi:hypothetical protein
MDERCRWLRVKVDDSGQPIQLPEIEYGLVQGEEVQILTGAHVTSAGTLAIDRRGQGQST